MVRHKLKSQSWSGSPSGKAPTLSDVADIGLAFFGRQEAAALQHALPRSPGIVSAETFQFPPEARPVQDIE
jgi:hypothetical protein